MCPDIIRVGLGVKSWSDVADFGFLLTPITVIRQSCLGGINTLLYSTAWLFFPHLH